MASSKGTSPAAIRHHKGVKMERRRLAGPCAARMAALPGQPTRADRQAVLEGAASYLLPDAEIGEDAIQQVLAGGLAGDLAQSIYCLGHIDGHQVGGQTPRESLPSLLHPL